MIQAMKLSGKLRLILRIAAVEKSTSPNQFTLKIKIRLLVIVAVFFYKGIYPAGLDPKYEQIVAGAGNPQPF